MRSAENPLSSTESTPWAEGIPDASLHAKLEARSATPWRGRAAPLRDAIRPLYARYYDYWHANWARVEDASFVSFTFDEFPSSAVNSGGKIIAEIGTAATFYATSGPSADERYSKYDLDTLLAEGHELGCHTDSHLRVGRVPGRTFERDDATASEGGWLVFYTHDLSMRPSPFGCTPADLETLASRAVAAGVELLPVGEVVARLRPDALDVAVYPGESFVQRTMPVEMIRSTRTRRRLRKTPQV